MHQLILLTRWQVKVHNCRKQIHGDLLVQLAVAMLLMDAPSLWVGGPKLSHVGAVAAWARECKWVPHATCSLLRPELSRPDPIAEGRNWKTDFLHKL